MADIITRTLSSDHITPVRAYAALRAQAPERSSFLLESAFPWGGRGRYSILGYRARGETLYPGGGNALSLFAEDLVGEDVPEGLAARLSRSLVGYIAYDAIHPIHRIEPWPDEGDLARMMRNATVVVFDSQKHTLTIAGASKGAVDRCEWEMTRGPELKPLQMPDLDAIPEHLDVLMTDAIYSERVDRARKHIASGAASSLLLARSFRAPLRGSDPFDVYRALRVLSPAPYHFFLEFAETPMAAGLSIVGSSLTLALRMKGGRVTLRPITGLRQHDADGDAEGVTIGGAYGAAGAEGEPSEHAMLVDAAKEIAQRHCEPGSVEVRAHRVVERYGGGSHIASEVSGTAMKDFNQAELLGAAITASAMMGSPKERTAAFIRELETSPRGVYGGVVGYAIPGSTVELAIATSTIVARNGYLETKGGAFIAAVDEPGAEVEQSRSSARAALAAIRVAQDLAKVRQEAERAARAKAEAENTSRAEESG